jgi:hypothetical protein
MCTEELCFLSRLAFHLQRKHLNRAITNIERSTTLSRQAFKQVTTQNLSNAMTLGYNQGYDRSGRGRPGDAYRAASLRKRSEIVLLITMHKRERRNGLGVHILKILQGILALARVCIFHIWQAENVRRAELGIHAVADYWRVLLCTMHLDQHLPSSTTHGVSVISKHPEHPTRLPASLIARLRLPGFACGMFKPRHMCLEGMTPHTLCRALT